MTLRGTTTVPTHSHLHIDESPWRLTPGRLLTCRDSSPVLRLLALSCDSASYEEDFWHPDHAHDKAETGIAELPRGDQSVSACRQPLQCYMQPCLAPPAATVLPLHSNRLTVVPGCKLPCQGSAAQATNLQHSGEIASSCTMTLCDSTMKCAEG